MDKQEAIVYIQQMIDVCNIMGVVRIYIKSGLDDELKNVLDYLINSESIIHSHWEKIEDEYGESDEYACAYCGFTIVDAERRGDPKTYGVVRCPNCGAKMEG